MKWIRVWALVMGLGLVGTFGFSGCGESSPKDTAQADGTQDAKPNENLATPEKTLESLKAVDSQRKYSEFCQLFTQEARRTLAGGLLMSGKDLKGYITNPDNQNLVSEEDKVLVGAVDDLFKKHAVDRALDIQMTLPTERNGELLQTQGEQAADAEQQILQTMGEKISDPCLFVADFIKTMRTHGRNPEARIIEADARLEKLTQSEKTAEAELVFTRDGQEVRRPIGFQKVSGEWQISQVPDVFFK